MERPELRQFKTDALSKALGDRVKYVFAALTVMRARVISGPRKNICPKLGSFAAWSYLVRDALVWLGEPDPCDTMDRMRAIDPIAQQLGELLRQWHTVLGSGYVTAAHAASVAEQLHSTTVGSNARTHPDFHSAMLAIAPSGRDTIDINRLGRSLARHKDRVIAGLRFVRSPTVTGGVCAWAVV